MPADRPERKFSPLDFGGVWDESANPKHVASALTFCLNLWYRRFRSWGKRPGSGQAYGFTSPGPTPGVPVSGIRWYRAAPSPLTQLIVAAQGALWQGTDPDIGDNLTEIATFSDVSTQPIDFCSAYDPSARNGLGSDILIICGATGPYGFATGSIILDQSLNPPAAGQIITMTFKNVTSGYTVTCHPYTVLPTDDLAAVQAALVRNVNASAAVTIGGNGTSTGGPAVPFMNQALALPFIQGNNTAAVLVAALNSGTPGNAFQYDAVLSGTSPGVAITPTSLTNLSGGGSTVTNPLRWDGNTLAGLSPYITQPFTGCTSWHSHVWYWGDPNNPDTVYASDINQPEGWSFMTENGGGGTSGGYDIARGDGDPYVRVCTPAGNTLYVFKGQNIYAINGYDFQGGEYQFSVQPAIIGHGTVAKECVATLHNALVFWDGAKFLRLQVGAYDVEEIAPTIPFQQGNVALGNEMKMRAIAGDFMVRRAPLSGNYLPPPSAPPQTVFNKVAMFACDVGNGVADTIFVYDDAASAILGEYAWSMWTGWTVDAWIAFGKGQNANNTKASEPANLFWIPPAVGSNALVINQFGVDPSQDSGVGIPWRVHTGWLDCGMAWLNKDLHRVLLEVESYPGCTFTVTVIKADSRALPASSGSQTSTTTRTNVSFPITVGPDGIESYQALIATLEPYMSEGWAYMLHINEPGTDTSFEIVGAMLDSIENPTLP